MRQKKKQFNRILATVIKTFNIYIMAKAYSCSVLLDKSITFLRSAMNRSRCKPYYLVFNSLLWCRRLVCSFLLFILPRIKHKTHLHLYTSQATIILWPHDDKRRQKRHSRCYNRIIFDSHSSSISSALERERELRMHAHTANIAQQERVTKEGGRRVLKRVGGEDYVRDCALGALPGFDCSAATPPTRFIRPDARAQLGSNFLRRGLRFLRTAILPRRPILQRDGACAL